jgi:hypothetical protein
MPGRDASATMSSSEEEVAEVVSAELERTLAPPETDSDFWTRDHLLRHSEGYIVDGPSGHLGFVSEVIETGSSVELVVQTDREELRVPSSAIEAFDPLGERIVVALGAR